MRCRPLSQFWGVKQRVLDGRGKDHGDCESHRSGCAIATFQHGDGAQIKGITYVFKVAKKAIAATGFVVLLLAIWEISFGEIQSSLLFHQNSAGLLGRCGIPASPRGISGLSSEPCLPIEYVE
jgi:hypothetical protein